MVGGGYYLRLAEILVTIEECSGIMLHIDFPSRTDVEALFLARAPVCVSIYLPTSPMPQEAGAHRIVLKNLVAEALGQLTEHDKRTVRAIEGGLLDVVDDDEFWEFQANSLAAFATEAVRVRIHQKLIGRE